MNKATITVISIFALAALVIGMMFRFIGMYANADIKKAPANIQEIKNNEFTLTKIGTADNLIFYKLKDKDGNEYIIVRNNDNYPIAVTQILNKKEEK